jgi:hypothetical protein
MVRAVLWILYMQLYEIVICCVQVKIRHMAVQEWNNNKNYNCRMSQWNVQNQSCVLLVALLTVKDCHKVVQKLYVPSEFRQEILCVAVSYVVGSLAFEYVMGIWNSQALLFWCNLLCLGVCTPKVALFNISSCTPYCNIVYVHVFYCSTMYS